MDTAYILFMMDMEGMLDPQKDKIESACNDMRMLKERGFSPHFYLEDVLHHNGLDYHLLSSREIQQILNA